MNKRNIFKSILVGICVLAVSVSCDMDLEPTTAIVFDEDEPLLQSQSDIESFQNGVLASYRSLFSGSFDQSSDVMCDCFNATTGFGNNYGAVHRADDTFTASDQQVESLWASHYLAIKDYNIAIEQAEMIEDEALLPYADLLRGIALFCRASSYLTLTRYFGAVYDENTAADDLSVPLVVSYDYAATPFRATVEEVYDQILLDLDDAEDLLSELGLTGSARAYLPTVDAVKALKARYYLDTKDYRNAAKMALSVINNTAAGYALANTAQLMQYEYDYDSGTEPILQLFAKISEGTIAKTVYTLVGNDDVVGKYFSPYYLPSANLLDAYDPSDLRLLTWFTSTMYPVKMNGSYYEDVYVFTKYLGNPGLMTGDIENGAHAAKPLMISEMYLIAAEAYAMQNNTGTAKRYLNKLQEARGAEKTSGTMENVKKEWLRETVGDGQRLICLKRWGDGIAARPSQASAGNIVMTGASYDDRTVDSDSRIFNWPIPSYELKITPSLEQNPGYSETNQ